MNKTWKGPSNEPLIQMKHRMCWLEQSYKLAPLGEFQHPSPLPPSLCFFLPSHLLFQGFQPIEDPERHLWYFTVSLKLTWPLNTGY